MNWLEQLANIAVEMDSVRLHTDAKLQYHVITDAIVWSDEYPDKLVGRTEQFECLKLVLRYRTTLLLGDPDLTFKPYWDRARELFPNWAGFNPKRLAPSDETTAFYLKRSDRDLRHLMRMSERINCSKPDSGH
jgi:hypothetical protein